MLDGIDNLMIIHFNQRTPNEDQKEEVYMIRWYPNAEDITAMDLPIRVLLTANRNKITKIPNPNLGPTRVKAEYNTRIPYHHSYLPYHCKPQEEVITEKIVIEQERNLFRFINRGGILNLTILQDYPVCSKYKDNLKT